MSKPVLLNRPAHCPSGYSMHFYCKYENSDHRFQEFPWEFTECETRTASIRAARERGWLFHRGDSTATCPKCAKALGLGIFKKAQP